MPTKRADAFQDVSSNEDEQRIAQVERAHALLDEQADALMATDPPDEDLEGARHSPHNPHRRALSSAALKLLRAHAHVEEASQD
jgi:hypothetical protein